MRPITLHTRKFPARQFHAITIFPIIFYKEEKLSDRELRHEAIHLWQQAALLIVLFYVLYLIFWVIGLLRYRNSYRAYREIPFERSAYSLESLPRQSGWRQAFDWIRRVKGEK